MKSAFRKYVVKFHPDRVIQSGDPGKIYVSNAVFAGMTDAFNAFKKEHGMK